MEKPLNEPESAMILTLGRPIRAKCTNPISNGMITATEYGDSTAEYGDSTAEYGNSATE